MKKKSPFRRAFFDKGLRLLHLAIFIYCGSSFGQMFSAKEVDIFNTAYRRGIDEMRVLMGMRGVPFEQALCDSNEYNNYHRILRTALNQAVYKSDALADGFNEGDLGLLIYSHHRDTLHIFYLAKEFEWYVYSLVSAEELVEHEASFRTQLGVDQIVQARGKTITLGKVKGQIDPQKTSELLGIKQLLPQIKKIKHLIIIPELNIGQIPLVALPLDSGRTLIDYVSMSIGPHLCNLYYKLNEGSRYRKQSLSEGALVIGNPIISNSLLNEYHNLPGAEIESDTVFEWFGGVQLKREEATAKALFENAKRFRMLYFACHGYYDPKLGLKGSYLVLAPDSAHPDGKLPASEIQHKDWENVEVAILSACQTGVGLIAEAGFIGLGRAFYKAGVENTVMSLWSVDDASTLLLMKHFAKAYQMNSKFPVADALRYAMIEARKVYQEPIYWAPFVVFGFP